MPCKCDLNFPQFCACFKFSKTIFQFNPFTPSLIRSAGDRTNEVQALFKAISAYFQTFGLGILDF